MQWQELEERSNLEEGCRVYCVAAGTIVGRDKSGRSLMVTEEVSVNIGSEWWVTRPVFELVQAMEEKKRHKLQ